MAEAMWESYKGIYRDQHGDEAIVIQNDGKQLSMTLRGVEFSGNHAMSMMPVDPADRPALASFTFNRFPHEGVDLCACAIDYEVPLPVVNQQQTAMALLTVSVELGSPIGRGMLDREHLRLSFTLNGKTYHGNGIGGDFETELNQIQGIPGNFSALHDKENFLPEGVYMKACINCAFSDYSVFGKDIFGDLICFRNNKVRYLAVKTKRDYMGLGTESGERVQETYLCLEFERRVPGMGYRG